MTKPSLPLIVAIGASAGGLEAFTELLSVITDQPGFAVVFVQHLDPNSKSLLADLLRKQTSLSVEEIATRKTIKPNTVYLCPPRARLNVRDETLVVSNESGDDSETNIIDHFFHSIAETQGQRGIGVILSGSGSDGTLGLKSINDAGGMTFAQDSPSAKFDSMPRNAATTGVADRVMPPQKIATELLKYARYLDGLSKPPAKKKLDDQINAAIPQIARTLLAETGHNFKHYKTSTLGRRIQRRIQILKLGDVDAYVKLLQEDKSESQQLFRELLISVTAFFRDPDSFACLADEVIPKLFENRPVDDPVRIWVPGCATGEEAYSIAIVCHEHLSRLAVSQGSDDAANDDETGVSGRAAHFQVFASDIDERALSIARNGVYPAGIVDHVSEDRLERFFVKKGNRYHVKQAIRETVLFSPHNLISDPPFSRQDMISCRNLLIYLGPHLQKKLIPLFHFALRPKGFLFLGPSESISTHGDLFQPVDPRHRISQRKGTTIGRSAPLSLRAPSGGMPRMPDTLPVDDDKSDVVQIMQRIILDEFAPKSVVIDEGGQVICSSSETNKYLSIGDGAFQNNILKMARRGLRIGLRATLSQAKAKRRRIVHENLSVQTDDGKQRVMITVQPMMRLGEDTGLFIVVFHDVGLPMGLSENSDAPVDPSDVLVARGAMDRQAEAMIEQLERELATTRDDLEKAIQEMEATNEELKSSNEELLSMNEELQSANEELETSKEEIRASSEAVGRANADLENLLRSTRIATIFLDDERCIRSFTPATTDIYGLIPTDIGRPLGQIVPNVIEMPPLPDASLLDPDEPIEDTVTAHDGQIYIRRVLPYQNETGGFDGMVVTFTNVSELEASRRQLQTFTDAVPPLMAIVDRNQRFTFANKAYSDYWQRPTEQIVGHTIAEVVSEEACRQIKPYMDRALAGERVKYELSLQRPVSGETVYQEVVYVPQKMPGGQVEAVHVVITDKTESKRAAMELARREAHLRRVINNQVGLVGVIDRDGILVEVDDRSLAIAQVKREEVVGKHFAEAPWWSYDPAVADQIRDAMQRAMDGEIVRYDVSLSAAGDDGVMIDFMIAPVKNDAGEVEYLIPSGVDIADRKRAETELAIAKERLDLSLEVGQVAPWSWDMETNEPVTNAMLNRTFGFDEDAQPKLTEFLDRMDESVRDRIASAIEHSMNTGEIYDQEHPIRWPSGEVRHVRARGNVRTSDDGKLEDFFGVVQDITDRKRSELASIDRERQMRLAIEVAKLGMGTIDYRENTVALSAEAAELYGLGDGAITVSRKRLHQTFHPDEADDFKEAIERCLSGENEGLISLQHRVVLPDGGIRWVDVCKQIFCDESIDPPKPTHGILMARDITDQKSFEDELQERWADLRRIIDNQLNLVGVIDHNGIMLEVNEIAMKVGGVTRQDIIGKPFWECVWWQIDEDSRLRCKESVERALAGELIRYDCEIQTAGDERMMIDFMLVPTKDANGKVTHVIPSGVDIRDRHAATSALAESRGRLKTAMRAAKMGSFVWDRVTDETIWDEEWQQTVGMEVLPGPTGKAFFDMIYPEDLNEVKNAARESLDGNTDFKCEFRIIRPDGELRWLAGAGNWINDQSGEPRKLAGLNWDITDQKEYELAIRLNEERLRVAAGAAGFGMFHVDLDNNQVVWSDEFKALVGVDPRSNEDIPIGAIPDFIHPDDRSAVRRFVDRTIADLDEPDHWCNHRIVKKNGEVRHVRMQTRSLYDGEASGKRIRMIVGTLLDVTQQREFETKLKKAKRLAEAANASKSEFVANMSHEIRTPMTAILGYAEMLREYIDDETALGHLSTIRRNGGYLLEIINDILDLSKIEAGKLDVDIERFEPARVVEDVRSIMEVRAAESGLKLHVNYETKIPQFIESDAKRLKQILINLLGNAIKFTEQGEVKINVAYEVNTLRFAVTDTGIGMTDDQQDRLFKPFSQGDTLITQQYGGTGLGLAISQRIAVMLGGEISVDSKLDQGSTFTVTIKVGRLDDTPLVQPMLLIQPTVPAEPTIESDEPEEVRLSADVLIVDDRRDIRLLSKHLITKAGGTVTEAEDGLIAVETVKQANADGKTFDLILLDMQMPNLDGYETAASLRKLGFTGPIIALTADAMQGDMSKCLEAGCNDYLSKPIDATKMLQLVGKLTKK